MTFESQYKKVQHIVEKARKEYYLKSWEVNDWHQEGMLVLYELQLQHRDILDDESRLYRYYKVKFRNYIKDQIRKQESQKRKFDRMPYEEVSELSHSIPSGGLLNDELVALRNLLHSYREGLSPREAAQYQKLIQGERFPGRQKMLADLRKHLKDYAG